MIQGLKVTVDGKKVREIALKRADYHTDRAKFYAAQAENMREAERAESDDGPVKNYSGGNPIDNMLQRRNTHENLARELEFLAENLDVSEIYLLDRPDLHILGIVTDRY